MEKMTHDELYKKQKEIRSNSSTVKVGNTKQLSQISNAKHWMFTLNNHKLEDIRVFLDSDKEIVPRFVFQEERGDAEGWILGEHGGTIHLQGYLMFAEKRRPHTVFKNKRTHWEICRNIPAAIKYCQKINTRLHEVPAFFRGLEPTFTLEMDLWCWQKVARDIIDSKPDDRSIYWFWEQDGCTGKTTFAKWAHLHCERVLCLSGSPSDMKNGIVQYQLNQYCLPKTIIINIPREAGARGISYKGIEEIKDCFFYSAKYEGSMVCGHCPHVIVFANCQPIYDKLTISRWKVFHIAEMEGDEYLKLREEDQLKCMLTGRIVN